jgi:hypothetical protein
MFKFLIVMPLAAAAALTPATAQAGQPVTQLLNPAPPGFYSCKPVGAGTICQGTQDASYGPTATDIPCVGFDVFDSGVEHVRATRYYDGNGNLTRRVLHTTFSQAEWSNPITGKAVGYTQNNVQTDVPEVPGDLTTSREIITGEVIIRAGNGSPVLIATGRQVFTFDQAELISSAGRNAFIAAFFEGDTHAFDQVCAALS